MATNANDGTISERVTKVEATLKNSWRHTVQTPEGQDQYQKWPGKVSSLTFPRKTMSRGKSWSIVSRSQENLLKERGVSLKLSEKGITQALTCSRFAQEE